MDTEVLYVFKGLYAAYDLRGNWLGGRASLLGQRFDDVHRGDGTASSLNWRRYLILAMQTTMYGWSTVGTGKNF